MQRSANPYPTSFKAAVALAAIRGKEPIEQLAESFSVTPALISEWRENLERNADLAFAEDKTDISFDSVAFRRNELAKTIAENSTQGVAVINPDGYCIYANQSLIEMTGFSTEELYSKPLHDLIHHHYADGMPYPIEDCPLAGSLSGSAGIRAYEETFFKKDGTPFDVVCAASPVVRSGKSIAAIIEVRDVTKEKNQQKELVENEQFALQLAKAAEESRRELNAFLDAVPVGIGMATKEGKLVVINRANKELWGQNLAVPENVAEYEEFKGWWADGKEHHGHPLAAHEWALALALQGHDVDDHIVEIEPFNAPGKRKTVCLSSRPIYDTEEKVVGGVVAQVDITRQKRLEESLRQADKNKDDFIALLAHELRNPLAPIRAAVDLFYLLAPENQVLKKATDAMARQVSHITRLVDDLLDVARVSRGKVELKFEFCDIAKIVAQTADDYRPTLQAKGVELWVDTPSSPVWVNGDSARLAQIIGNLLHNAAKFTSAGNRIFVSVRQENLVEQLVAITVRDDGAGMEPELVSQLFSPFIQAAQGLARSSGGLGLGLTLVKGFAQLHGGTVEASSPGLFHGSKFTVRLPSVAHCSKKVQVDDTVEPVSKLRIVAIDDNKDALDMLSLLLNHDGHQVELAYSGERGLEMVKGLKPDAVICDIGLPGSMNGYDIARAIRQDEALKETFLIALSGYGQEGDKRMSRDAGFDAHLVKPMCHREFESVLRKVAEKSAINC